LLLHLRPLRLLLLDFFRCARLPLLLLLPSPLPRLPSGPRRAGAMRLEKGNFAWAGENVTKQTRVIDVVYNASNNELVRTKTLVKGAIVLVDATPFKAAYEKKYQMAIKKKAEGAAGEKFSREPLPASVHEKTGKPRHSEVLKKYSARQAALVAGFEVDPKVEEQLTTGRLHAKIMSRPGQSGRLDGIILEGAELEFYKKKIDAKKSGKHA
jgi:small subunit ribosomal protein S8e